MAARCSASFMTPASAFGSPTHGSIDMISLTTFGKSPAAMYLAALLCERNDQQLARKVGRALHSQRELMNDIVACHYETNELKTASFSKLMTLLDHRARETGRTFKDEHIGHLVVNILVGEIKTMKNRAARAAILKRMVARQTEEGLSVPEVKAFPMADEESEEARIEKLRQRSKRYLARKGKRDTLY